MPIEVYCQTCRRKLRLPDTTAGKGIKCPQCQGVIRVPAAVSPSAETPAPAEPTSATPVPGVLPVQAPKLPVAKPLESPAPIPTAPAPQWFVQTEDGQQWGPISRAELDQWHAQGRITADTQLLQEGSPRWQWANDVYPDLTPQQAATAPAAEFAGIAIAEPAAAKGPFDFAVSPASSVSSRVRAKTPGRGRKKEGSPQIDYIAIAAYAMGALNVFASLIIVLSASALAALFDDAQSSSAAAHDAIANIFIGIAIGVMVLSIVLFACGYGLQARAKWGRVLMLTVAILSALALNPLNIAFAVWCWIVLTDKQNKHAFH